MKHALFAAAATARIRSGTTLEEQGSGRSLGASCDEYARRVPGLLQRRPRRGC